MPLRIVQGAAFTDDVQAIIDAATHGHEHRFARAPVASNLVAAPADEVSRTAEVYFGQPSLDLVASAHDLRWVHLTSAGYTRYDTPDARALFEGRSIALTTSSSVYAEPCAEHAIALLLALCRELPAALEDQRGARTWPSADLRQRSRTLAEMRVAVLGYGAIGRRACELLRACGARVVATRNRPRGDEATEIVSFEELCARLGDIDAVIDTLPESLATRGMIDARFFGALRAGALFVNVGRGTTVVTEALVDALASGRLVGAGLDVTDPEPLPPEHPLWSLPNCIVTPHTAGGRGSEMVSLARHFAANLRRLERGEPLVDRVL